MTNILSQLPIPDCPRISTLDRDCGTHKNKQLELIHLKQKFVMLNLYRS